MDSENKVVLILCVSAVLVFFSAFGLLGYMTYLRSKVIDNSQDPLYAACAFDASGYNVPPSCVMLISQTGKELPR